LTYPWLANPAGRRVGEVWFPPPAGLPILVKFLFTAGRLSVQVHPDDEYARERNHSAGKTEMWYVLKAEPGAMVGLGLKPGVSREDLGAAIGTARLESMLEWFPAASGDTFFVPAGTIHVIGGGLIVCEVQQQSDITYRLWDYGSNRELHLVDGLNVSRLQSGGGRRSPEELAGGWRLLAECAHFRTELLSFSGTASIPARNGSAICVVLDGEGDLAGQSFEPGHAFELPPAAEPWRVTSPAASLLATFLPGRYGTQTL
jgi:mannose-6-phosphate isomerase